MYSFVNLLISTDILLIISFFLMFIVTIVAIALVLISLFYLYSNKIRKKSRGAITIVT